MYTVNEGRMYSSLLVTGGAGFIGSYFIRYMLERYPALNFIDLDALTYAGNLVNLGPWRNDSRHEFVHGEIGDAPLVDTLMRRDRRYAINADNIRAELDWVPQVAFEAGLAALMQEIVQTG